MRPAKVVASGIAIVALVVTGAAIALSRVDPAVFKDFLAETVKEATGREVLVRGATELDLFPAPTLVAENVLFSNAPWSVSPDMVRVKRLEAQVGLLPLLAGQLRITRFTLQKPHILLERHTKNRRNWRFERTTPGVAEERPTPTLPAGLRLVVSEIHIVDGLITYRDNRRKVKKLFRLHKLSAKGDVAGGPLVIKGHAEQDKRDWRLTAEVGELSALFRNEPYDIALTLRTAGVKLDGEGVVERPMEGAGVWMNLELEADSGRQLAAIVSKDVALPGAVHGTAKFTDVEGGFRLDEMTMKVRLKGGAATITGSIDNLVTFKGLDLGIALKAKTLDSIATLTGKKLPVMGPVSATARLTDPKGRYRLDELSGRLSMGSAVLGFKGSIANLRRVRGLDIGLTLKAKSLARLSKYTGVELPRVGPVETSARLSRTKHGYKLARFHAEVGRTDLKGELYVYPKRKRPRLIGKVDSKVLDLDQFMPRSRSDEGGPIFSSKTLPISALRRFDSELQIKARKVRFQRLRMDRVNATFSVANGRLKILPKGRLAGGTFSAELSVDARNEHPKIATHIRGKRVALGTLTQQLYKVKLIEGGRADINIEVKGRGDSMRELMAGLWGGVHVSTGKATINNDLLDKVGSGMLPAVLRSVTMQAPDDEVTHMRCGVVRMVIKDGFANADRTIAMETDRMLMSASGTIDLRDERLDFGVNVRARHGFQVGAGSLSGLVRVRGTISEPKLGADAAGVAGAAATVAGAVATGGLSLLAQGILSRVLADRHPCKTALSGGKGRTREAVHENRGAGSRDAGDSSGDAAARKGSRARSEERAKTNGRYRRLRDPAESGN